MIDRAAHRERLETHVHHQHVLREARSFLPQLHQWSFSNAPARRAQRPHEGAQEKAANGLVSVVITPADLGPDLVAKESPRVTGAWWLGAHPARLFSAAPPRAEGGAQRSE